PEHFGERFDRPVDEAAAAIVEAEAQQNVRVLEPAQLGTLEQRLMRLDGASDLSFLAIQVAENQMDLERIAGRLRGLGQLLDRLIDRVRQEEVEAEHVVRRFARAAPIDPHAVLQLVALPRLADGETRQQGDEADEQREWRGDHSLKRIAETTVVERARRR